MPDEHINWDDIPEADHTLLVKGIYDCTVHEATHEISAADNLYWKIVLKVDDHEDRLLFFNISFHPKALPYTKEALSALYPEALTDNAFNYKDVEHLYNLPKRKVRALVTQRVHQGELHNNVRALYAPQ